ncbi:MAG: membrane protein insertase YidC [Acidimicrobiales bacterium]|nr:membrane protein insertase YidC [Acidimicrobiales bacterium]
MFDAIATLLSWFYDLVPNYAFAIAALTLCVMIVLTPLTLKGTRSMMAMQRLQPEMKKIQQQYKGDRQKLNEELMKFYQENKINPLGGCLPLILQMPVFIVLYRVLHGLTKIDPETGNFDPAYLDKNSQMYQDLSKTNEMMALGMNLAESAAKALGDSILHGIPYLILVLAVASTSYIQQRQISVRNQRHGQAMPVNSQQQMLLRVLPAFFAVISLTLPAGIVLYFLVSNLYRIGQQAFISRTMAKDVLARSGEGSEESGGPKGSTKVVEATATETDGNGAKPGPSRPPKGSSTPPKGSTTPPKGTSTPPKGGATPAKRPTSGRVTPPGQAGRRKRK